MRSAPPGVKPAGARSTRPSAEYGGVYISNGKFMKSDNSNIANNVVQQQSNGSLLDDRGHEIYAVSGSTVKRQETNVGVGVNLSFDGTTATPE